jgi:proteasome lid subunit RPN8/RPN11
VIRMQSEGRWVGDGLCALREAARSASGELAAAAWTRGGEVLFSQLKLLSQGEDWWEADPQQLVEAEEEGWCLAGIAHTHPGGRCSPSNADYQQLASLREWLGVPVRGWIWARCWAGLGAGDWKLIEYDEKKCWPTSPLRAVILENTVS